MSRSLEEIKDNMSYNIDDSVGLASVMYKFDTDDYTCVSVFAGDAVYMDDETLHKEVDNIAKAIYNNTEKAKSHIGFEINPDSFYAMYDDEVLYAVHGSGDFDIDKMNANIDKTRDLYAAMVGVDSVVRVCGDFEKYDVKDFDIKAFTDENYSKNRFASTVDKRDIHRSFAFTPITSYLEPNKSVQYDSNAVQANRITSKDGEGRIRDTGERPLPYMSAESETDKQYE